MRVKSVVVIFTSGGQSQLDTWDPKPNALEEIRGVFRTTQTKNPELRVCEHLPRLAALADRYCVLKSMTHDDLDHGSACYLALHRTVSPKEIVEPAAEADRFSGTRRDREPHQAREALPAHGSSRQRAAHCRVKFRRVSMAASRPRTSRPNSATSLTQLGSSRPSICLRTCQQSDWHSGAICSPSSIPAHRRSAFAESLRTGKRAARTSGTELGPRTGEAPRPLRPASFWASVHHGAASRSKPGVPWVNVFFNHGIRGQDDYPDDTGRVRLGHTQRHFRLTQNASTAAIRSQRFGVPRRHAHTRPDGKHAGCGDGGIWPARRWWLWKRTLPERRPGRKHWAACYSVLLAGRGITPGAVFGKSDRIAAYPQAEPTTPGDLAATMFHALGIPADAHYTDATNRPYRSVTGNPVTKLFNNASPRAAQTRSTIPTRSQRRTSCTQRLVCSLGSSHRPHSSSAFWDAGSNHARRIRQFTRAECRR